MSSGDPSIAGTIRPETSSGATSPRSSRLAGLIASRVYASPDNSARPPRTIIDSIDLGSHPTAGQACPAHAEAAIPFYTNPARRNEVATQIALGRSLDVQG